MSSATSGFELSKWFLNLDNNDTNNNSADFRLSQPFNFKEEKLKVDRKKFEALLNNESTSNDSAEIYFNNVMREFSYQVVITWPLKLKPGTKSKKDPHVKLSGPEKLVKKARIMILEKLDPKRDRVTLKMDVDWTAHAHIIGKGGSSIQSVMDATGCHVHFPDANRTNSFEKSNQVSIAGTSFGVNQARIAIRQLLPILISFSLVLKPGARLNFLDKLNRAIQFVEQLSSTQITLRFSAPNFMAQTIVTVFVRGTYGNCSNLKIAVDFLHKFMDELFTDNVVVYEMNTEISSQHHNFVIGAEQINLKAIMKSTGAIIKFPETSKQINSSKDIFNRLSNISVATEPILNKKTSVLIQSNSIDSLLSAFNQIQIQLPLSLTFDLKEGQELNCMSIEAMTSKWGIHVVIKDKAKQNTKTIWFKAAEKDQWKLFEARRYILEMDGKGSRNLWTDSIWSNSVKDELILTESRSDFARAPGAERELRI